MDHHKTYFTRLNALNSLPAPLRSLHIGNVAVPRQRVLDSMAWWHTHALRERAAGAWTGDQAAPYIPRRRFKPAVRRLSEQLPSKDYIVLAHPTVMIQPVRRRDDTVMKNVYGLPMATSVGINFLAFSEPTPAEQCMTTFDQAQCQVAMTIPRGVSASSIHFAYSAHTFHCIQHRCLDLTQYALSFPRSLLAVLSDPEGAVRAQTWTTEQWARHLRSSILLLYYRLKKYTSTYDFEFLHDRRVAGIKMFYYTNRREEDPEQGS